MSVLILFPPQLKVEDVLRLRRARSIYTTVKRVKGCGLLLSV